jgi:phosphatidylserine decarboxylase
LSGLIRLNVHEAVISDASKGREYFVTVSVGKQTCCSHGATATTSADADLQLNSGAAFVLQKDGATMARIAVFKQGRLDGAFKNYLVAWAEIDLANFFQTGAILNTLKPNSQMNQSLVIEETLDLVDPENSKNVVGHIRVSGKASSLEDLERQVWQQLLLLADFDGNNVLSEDEFNALLIAFGSELTESEIHDLYIKADTDGDGHVNVNELANLLACFSDVDDVDSTHFSKIVKRCPIDGAELSTDPDKQASNLLYVWLALSAARLNHESDLKAGYLTESQASQSWMLRLSEWASHPLAVTSAAKKKSKKKSWTAGGLRTGARASHILIYNRADRRVVEEAISPVLNMALRNMYQSVVGRALMQHVGLSKRLLALSIKEGNFRDSLDSAKEIEPFVESFRGQINVEDAELPLKEYKTFNQFFYRKLKPGSRPVASPDDPDVIVSAADCRLQVFSSIDEATRFWVKGRNFSIAGLLADSDPSHPIASSYSGGTMAIFRLAPQDYHRYHCPVDGKIISITDLPGDLLTVNPIAVNSIMCDVFTQNKRSIMMIDSPSLGKVAFIAIGATLVGTITWTIKVGARVKKGDELGFFAFGGSTCIVLFENSLVQWDGDLTANAQRSLETLVKVGERVGVRIGSGKEEKTEERKNIIKKTVTMAKEAGAQPLEERRDLKRLLSGEIDALSSPIYDDDDDDEEEEEDGQANESAIYNKVQQIKL